MDVALAEIEDLGRALVGEEAIFFPVRHHSPACAWHLQRLIRERRPCTILIEGPSGFDPLIPLIVDERARAPLAVYSYCVRQAGPGASNAEPDRFASYYPLCDYSPEMVALREGTRIGAALRFIDLDYAAQCALEAPTDDALESLLDERRWRDSAYLRALARRNGCRDHDELWDHLFESVHREIDTPAFITRLAAYCLLIRRETPPESLERDGTLAREAEMAWHVGEALAMRAALPVDARGPVLVVTGGFHTVALAYTNPREAVRPAMPAGRIVEQQAALIRYSFERLDRLNGYSAGMPSPAWYQALWAASQAAGHHESRDAALAVFFDVAERLRKEGERPGTTLLVAALEQAERLAQLRHHAHITRCEVLDAIRSCFVKGAVDAEGAAVIATTMTVLAGNAVGVLPPGTGVPPLVRDFERRAKRYRLRTDDTERRKLTLEIYRRPDHRQASRMLHGLSLLSVPFAVRIAGPDFARGTGLERLQEHWEYSFSPSTEGALVEAAVHGSTLPEAVATKFSAGLARLRAGGGARSARVAVGQLCEALVLGLHDHVPRIMAWLRECLAEDAEFPSVTTAVSRLVLLRESREPLEAGATDEIPTLLRDAYERACFLLGEAHAAPEAAERETAMAFATLRELLASADRNGLDPGLFWDALRRLAAEPRCRPFVAGAADGLLFATGRITESGLAKGVEGRLQGASEPRAPVAYIAGILLTAREAAWQVPELLGSIDGRVRAWSGDEFVRMLPELRLMFSAMTPSETDRIAEAVARLHGGGSIGPLVTRDVTPEQVEANLRADERVRAALARDGLAAWMEAPR